MIRMSWGTGWTQHSSICIRDGMIGLHGNIALQLYGCTCWAYCLCKRASTTVWNAPWHRSTRKLVKLKTKGNGFSFPFPSVGPFSKRCVKYWINIKTIWGLHSKDTLGCVCERFKIKQTKYLSSFLLLQLNSGHLFFITPPLPLQQRSLSCSQTPSPPPMSPIGMSFCL